MNRKLCTLIMLCLVCLLCSCGASSRLIYDLRCENLENPLSIDNTTPRLSWKLTPYIDGMQTAYQLLVATDLSLLEEGKADLWDSGKITSSESVMVKYSGKNLTGKPLIYWKVRVWDDKDKATLWSKTAFFGTGLSDSEIGSAQYIGFPESDGNPQSPLLRKKFKIENTKEKTLLYVNSLGYHEVYVNGKKVGDEVLTPAVSQLDKRSLYNTYDITPLTKKGDNDLVVWLGQGWYRPNIWNGYMGPLAKIWIKTLNNGKWNTAFVSDKSWQAAESGYSSIGSWRPHQFGGERVDASAMPEDMTPISLDKLLWRAAAEIDVAPMAVSPQMTEGNRIAETIRPRVIKQMDNNEWQIELRKAVTGRAEISFPQLEKGQEIIISYGDHFNAKGDLATHNQEDRYIASGRTPETFCSKFNYHGFQYIKISNLPTMPSIDDIKIHIIQTDFKEASSFSCSDSDMNAIHDMLQYTLRNLSLGGYLVDCPQIERLGYGGDGNASTLTAQTMFDLSPLYANWMQAWSDCMREGGSMPHTAPNPYSAGGGPYWCGFIITASWQTYVNYGDSRLIEKYYPEMQQWLGYVDSYSIDGLLEPWPVTEYRNWYLGDWATPVGVDQTNPASVAVVNNSFVSVCFDTMEKIARFLGKNDDAAYYAQRKIELQKQIHEKFYSDEKGIYGTGSQIDLAYPMLAGVTPNALHEKVTESLLRETEEKYNGHIACGLVGIPVITQWAVENNQPDFIYSMLKKRDYPSYLYMIDNGATTTWEHWNGERSRIHNCYNGIGSWFYQAVGGIRPDENEPGYKKVWISPQIPKGITWAKTTKETPYGSLKVEWKLENDILNLEITVPQGCTAQLLFPKTATEYTLGGETIQKKSDVLSLGSGEYNVTYPY